MSRELIDRKRLWAWLAVAMSAPLAHFSGGSWLSLLILGTVCGIILSLLPEESGITNSKALCALELVWIIVLLSQLLPLSARYWPGPRSELVIPVVLLSLGAYGCSRRASRVAGVLFWILVVIYAPVVIAGVKDIQLRWIMPQSMELSAWVIPVLLLPACSGFMPAETRTGKGWYIGIVIFALALWLITPGVLSPEIAAGLQTPFRELSRGLTIGAASRFESLIGVTVTLGWFALASFLIRCGSIFAERLGMKEKWCPWITAGGAVLLVWTGVQLNAMIAVIFTIILWILIPMLHEKIFSKKREKST